MKLRLILVAALTLAASPLVAQQPQLKTLREKASYSFGMSMGGTLKKQGVDIDIPLLIQGIKDSTGGKTVLTEQQAMEAMQAFEKEMIAKEAQQSQQFMTTNKRRPGVQSTPNGLQYKIVKPGKGARPGKNDVVRVNYAASFTNGTVFERNGDKPFTTPVNQVIPGWQEALQLMEVGSKWQLFIPPELAYGAEGSPPSIGPNMALVFELELVEIVKPAAGAPGATGATRRPATPGAPAQRGATDAARRPQTAPPAR
jgi:FKBP-type peptidyl-prolyl cis-trans isomerase